ncbi:hypothetical protein Y032_0382g377, partial [Ancylostoma ceylanicum]
SFTSELLKVNRIPLRAENVDKEAEFAIRASAGIGTTSARGRLLWICVRARVSYATLRRSILMIPSIPCFPGFLEDPRISCDLIHWSLDGRF